MMVTLRQCHVAAAQPKRNAVLQQLDDAVDAAAGPSLALRRHVTHLMMGSEMSGTCE